VRAQRDYQHCLRPPYVAVGQLLQFTPQEKWYLVYQSGPPMFSTADDPGDHDPFAIRPEVIELLEAPITAVACLRQE
jgi:hypothetical protein